MSDPRLMTWDEVGKHFYETGVDHCVLFVSNPNASSASASSSPSSMSPPITCRWRL